jgi:hypothetical protein
VLPSSGPENRSAEETSIKRLCALLRTQDVDVAAARALEVAVDPMPSADVPELLDSLQMGFLPIPGLDPGSPTTSFKVRGQSLRLDLLTPADAESMGQSVSIRRLGTAAQAMEYLDYVMAEPIRGAVIDGGGILVHVPRPERFAIHKLIVAANRPAVAHTRRDKDLLQAAKVFRILIEERPEEIELGWEALVEKGDSYVRIAEKGLTALEDKEPAITSQVKEAIG